MYSRKATYRDLYSALVDSPGWDCGDTVDMLYELCDYVGFEWEFIEESDYETLFNNLIDYLG